jgi:hypothetical protein
LQCSMVENGRRFRGAYCLHHQDYTTQHLGRQLSLLWMLTISIIKRLSIVMSYCFLQSRVLK